MIWLKWNEIIKYENQNGVIINIYLNYSHILLTHRINYSIQEKTVFMSIQTQCLGPRKLVAENCDRIMVVEKYTDCGGKFFLAMCCFI